MAFVVLVVGEVVRRRKLVGLFGREVVVVWFVGAAAVRWRVVRVVRRAVVGKCMVGGVVWFIVWRNLGCL